jgi:phosphoribosylamine--glycine ligase
VIAADRAEAESAVRAAMVEGRFGAAGSRIVIEEHLTGPEVSFFVLADGERAVPIGTAQDHKRLLDDDKGPNTGGMGAFAPSPLITPALADTVMSDIVIPVIEGQRAEGDPFQGFLYVSLMLTADGPKVIEFNVRLGDPEAQVLLPLLEGRLAHALLESARGMLQQADLRYGPHCYVGVVLATEGYPAASRGGQAIAGLDEVAALPDTLVFHSGTRAEDGRIVTTGGRALTVVGRGPSFGQAMARAYAAVERIHFDGRQYRSDIGRAAVARTAGRRA